MEWTILRHWRWIPLSFAVLGLAACGDLEEALEAAAAEACPAIEGDKHVDVATLDDDRRVMLHIAERECAVVGENRFVLYPIVEMEDEDSDMGGHMAAGAFEPAAMARHPEAIVVETVQATMPSMGHGPAKSPVIDAEQPSAFSVAFQMGGDWRLELGFRYADETTVHTARFDLMVR